MTITLRPPWRARISAACISFTHGVLATLAAVLDPPTLERLLAEGALLDEEAVCGLTLETTDRA